MNNVIALLEQELATKQASLTTNETAQTALLATLNIDQVDTVGNDFADKYAANLKENL